MRKYLRLLRLDHWIKNILIFPGFFFAFLVVPSESHQLLRICLDLVLGIFSFCLASSANYCLNEYIDAETDFFHPRKRMRVSVKNDLSKPYVFLFYFSLIFISVSIAVIVDIVLGFTVVFYIAMALFYNVKPFRLKDRKILDVLSESINNPIRFVLGWQLWSNLTIPPVSVLLAFWFIGAFLMGCKRLAEIIELSDQISADELKAYRKSLASYKRSTLMNTILIYSHLSIFFLVIFAIKYEYGVLVFCLIIGIWMPKYFLETLTSGKLAQDPEKLFKDETTIMFTLLILTALISAYFGNITSEMFSWLVESKILSIDGIMGIFK